MRKIPEYNDVELQLALDSEIPFPERITELDFYHQIKSNQKIRWQVNPFVTGEKEIRILLDPAHFNLWINLQRFGKVAGSLITYWGLRTGTTEMFFLLLVLPFTVAPLPHILFILCFGTFISIKLLLGISIPLFWVIVLVAGISYYLIKNADKVARRFIIKQGLNNWELFWRYYSLRIIYPLRTFNPSEFKKLIDRYPELLLPEIIESKTVD